MRSFSLGLGIFLVVLFVGGYFNVAGAPILDRVDSVIGTSILMDLHYGVFFFVYRGKENVESGITRTDQSLRDFQDKPIGIDNKKHYRRLEDASKN
ncbi:MAG: hypothetical protein HY912_19230 [Desulfomonile tiedjei]|uniref:Uncharacterized protein n=1 Tax=Desulfomonile tiedjei TaxID=2358 RepID=A0A9D6V3W9_9BACT|nr:hypothetical protein [Desulfomonile tiedjei]